MTKEIIEGKIMKTAEGGWHHHVGEHDLRDVIDKYYNKNIDIKITIERSEREGDE